MEGIQKSSWKMRHLDISCWKLLRENFSISMKNLLTSYFPTYYLTFQLYLFSKGRLQNISIIESICIPVTVQVWYIRFNLRSTLWIFKKLKSSMLIKLQWVTNLFLQNQVPNQFSQCMEWIELNSQTKELLSSLDHFLFILVSQSFFNK